MFSVQQSTPNRATSLYHNENNKENLASNEFVEKIVWDGSGNLDDLRKQIKLHKQQVPSVQPILQQPDHNLDTSFSGDSNLLTPKKKIVVIKERKTPSKPIASLPPSASLPSHTPSHNNFAKSKSKTMVPSSTPNPHKKVTFAQNKPKEDDFKADPNSLKNILQNRPVETNARQQRQTLNPTSTLKTQNNVQQSTSHQQSTPQHPNSTRFSIYTSNPNRAMFYPQTTSTNQPRLSIYQSHRPHSSSAVITDTPSKKEHLLQVQQKAARDFHALLMTPSKEFAKAMSQIGIPTNPVNTSKRQDDSFRVLNSFDNESNNVSLCSVDESREIDTSGIERPQNPLNKVFDSLEQNNKKMFGGDTEDDFPFYEPSDFVKQLLQNREINNKSSLY